MADTDISLMGCQSVSGTMGTTAFSNTTFSRISNGSVSMPSWLINADKTLVRYSGNDTFDLVSFGINEFSTVGQNAADSSSFLASGGFRSVTFTNGGASLSKNNSISWTEYK